MGNPLRGRDAELAAVANALRKAGDSGRGALIYLCGEPGIGKTALAQAIATQAADDGFVVGFGKAEELHQIAAGAPLLVALRSGPAPLLDADTFAGLAPLHHQPLWLVDRIASVLADLAARAPVLIVIDDAQWADQVTRFALEMLPGRLAASPVVWIIASREVPPAPAHAGDVDRHLLVLGPLSDTDLDALATDFLGGPPVGSDAPPPARRRRQSVPRGPAAERSGGRRRRRASRAVRRCDRRSGAAAECGCR
ncbi:ATP-binding protein [Mycobacterium crocinum]|uniref:ATP-binding protein n=2 Tax=Mycolicibacterium crocinum TaxID=388459 RepID=A0ABY3TLU7_9MYCO|nr:ATP-binding protein [Mycolicibacterium crocinum]MCV7218429.1 ATP-binding protein [Mycolicibacterium crocinum]ULN39930.2 ATP-binding protein [Mycolicibacterium crocinum]